MSQKGVLFACAAGNARNGEAPRDNDEYPFYPCNYPIETIVSVAASDTDDSLANFSYYGAQNVDIAAPGVNIYSTVLGTYGLDYKDGTSMATPHVVGALALLMAHYPNETSSDIINRLYAAAEPVDALKGKVRTGARLSMSGFFGISAPVEISVTQGTVADAVVVYWTAVNNGTHYRVWRATSEEGSKTLLCDWQQGLTFADETAEPETTYWYYIQAASSADGASSSTYSMGVSGFRPKVDASRLTVSFNANGGQMDVTSKVYHTGEKYAELPVPEYSGKVFLGWFTSAEGGTRLDSESYVRSGVTMLYAHWIDESALRVENLFARQRYPWNGLVDVTFNLFGVPADETASVSLEAKEENGGDTLTLRTFVGAAPTNLVNGAQHVVWNATADTQAILYTNMILMATVKMDEKPLLPPANVTAGRDASPDAVTVTWSVAANASSYEIWRATVNDITLASLLETVSETSFTDKSAVPGVTYYYWVRSLNAKKTSEYSASTEGKRKKVVAEVVISGPSSLAAGEIASFTCTVTYNDDKSANVMPTWSVSGGSTFASIDSAGVLTANEVAAVQSVTVTASYTYNGITKTATKDVTVNTKSVTVSFDANGGTVSPATKSYTVYGMYSSLPTPTRIGYTFNGWYTAASGGTKITASSTVSTSITTLYAQWKIVTHDKVQLWENGPYWATTNIGAEKPEDYGYYFWWGDTVGYKRENDKWVASDGSNSNFSFTESNTSTYDKTILTLQEEGWITSEGVLASEHDAAYVLWGGDWRMPTDSDLDQLKSNCDWVWTTMNGVTGYVVRGRGDYSANSIFLPCAGDGYGTSLRNAGSLGIYWSSDPGSDGNDAWCLYFYSGYRITSNDNRHCGRSVRPVQGAKSVTMTFDANGGVVSPTTKVYSINGTYDSLPTPTRSGYTFNGWYTAASGGTKITASSTVSTSITTLYAQWKIVTHDKVQLWNGGPYWATTNIGAEKPEDYGYYFWWGGTVGYKRENDKWVASNGSSVDFSFNDINAPTCYKIDSTLQRDGWITADGVLAPEHDAAQKHWGGDWRMPTDQEIRDLNNNCDWTWTTQNGVKGYVVRGRGDYSANSIFLPCAGRGYGSSLNDAGSCGNYWSSVPYSGNYLAWGLYFHFHSGDYDTGGLGRDYGQSVRPVQGAKSVTMTFDANGGTVSPTTKVYSINGTYGSLPTPTRSGYTFDGWYTAASGGTKITASSTVSTSITTLYAQWKSLGHDKVQLWENGPYWATTNIGAENPEDYGYYFWWGDTVGYKRENDNWVAADETLSNFSFESGNAPTYKKVNSTLQNEGWITSDGVLAPEHDAAHKHWGGDWRMPTSNEMEGLHSKCDWIWTTKNGVVGYVVNGKGDFSSNSIFLPCAGYSIRTSIYSASSYSYYWSSSPSSDYYSAWYLYFGSGFHLTNGDGTRYCGYPIRPLQSPVIVTITFDANGGSISPTTKEYLTNGTYGSLPTPTRSGYLFTGWYTAASGGTQVTAGTTVSMSMTTLYAQWKSLGRDKVQLWKNGPYWATTNIGAEKPEDYGYYFWWGDTVGYKRENDKWVASDGESLNFSFEEDNTPTHNKVPSTLQSEGWITADGILAPKHDAAQKHWGGDWRIPTEHELYGLTTACNWTRSSMNGVNGWIISGKGDYSANSIFLPCAGIGDGTSLKDIGSCGSYCSSEPNPEGYTGQFDASFHLSLLGIYYNRSWTSRYIGQSIRPVQGVR